MRKTGIRPFIQAPKVRRSPWQLSPSRTSGRKIIVGGLMLVWPFDLEVASEDAALSDPVLAVGVNGHEFLTHTWELRARKAKEILFTGAAFGGEQCHRLGMLNLVLLRLDLEAGRREPAPCIAKRPTVGLRLAKMAVDRCLEAHGSGQRQAAFALHHCGHANARSKYGYPVEPMEAELIRDEAEAARLKPRATKPRAVPDLLRGFE